MKTKPIATLAAALAAAVLLAAPPVAQAETVKTADTTDAAKPAASKTRAVKPAVKKKPVVTASRTNLKSAAANVAAGIEAAEAAMTPAELAIAERVQVSGSDLDRGHPPGRPESRCRMAAVGQQIDVDEPEAGHSPGR